MNSANDAIFYGDKNSVHYNDLNESAPDRCLKNGGMQNDYIMSNDVTSEGVDIAVDPGENGAGNAAYLHTPLHQHLPPHQGERKKKQHGKTERDKYDRIEEIEKYLNINNATNVCSLRIKLWEALMLYVNNVNAELIYFIINCLMEVEVYWGEEATNNLQDILSLINDKKYKEVSNKIGETLSISSRRDENSNNYNSDLACELNKILQYEHNRLSNQNNNKKLEYKIIEVSNAKEALLACLINSQILSVVLVDNLAIDEDYKKEKFEFYNFSEENTVNNKCGAVPPYVLKCGMVSGGMVSGGMVSGGMVNCGMVNGGGQMKPPFTHSVHNGSSSNSRDAMRNMILSNYHGCNGNNGSVCNNYCGGNGHCGNAHCGNAHCGSAHCGSAHCGSAHCGSAHCANNPNSSGSTVLNEHKKGANLLMKDYKFDIGNFVLGYEQLVAAPLEKMKKGFNSLVILIKSIAYIRSSVDIFCVCTSITLDKLQSVNNKIIRIFTTHDDHSDLHESILDGVKKKIKTPFFNALKAYAERPIGVFHALAISKGNSVRRSRWIQSLLDFYGVNLFKAESSATCGGLDSLLDPHGSLKEAQIMAARAYGSKYCFFVTNGTSSSNKIVMQALVKPGDIILVDRACHKSHHYGFVLSQALPCYLDPYPVSRYGIYGAVPIYVIKKTLLEYRNSNKLHLVKLIILTNCTFDGIVYNVKRVIEECLAIKPDLIFLFDEAWFAYACFHPILKFRTAMTVADKMRNQDQKKIYNKVHKKLLRKFGNVKSLNEVAAEKLLKTRLYPNPAEYKVRVYATQSIHKSLTSLRQGSVILISDDNFESHAYTPFKEAYYTHMSTSPNYQILATLDAGRAQMELEGYGLVEKQVEAAFLIRKELSEDPMISRYFRTLNAEDLIPDSLRQCHNLYMKRKKKFITKESYSTDSKGSVNGTYSYVSNNQGKGSTTTKEHRSRVLRRVRRGGSVTKYEQPIQSSNISSHECVNDTNGCTNHVVRNSLMLGDFTNNNSAAEGGLNEFSNNDPHGGVKMSRRRSRRDERNGKEGGTSGTMDDSNNGSMILNSENENLSFVQDRHNKNYSSSSYSTGMKNFLEYFECSWLSEDEFVLDPTRITLFTGYSGIDGDTFKVKWLMDKYGIQINKTSINSVLFQTNIGTTGSSCLFLRSCLSLISQELDQKKSLFNERDLNQFNDSVYNLVSNYIDLSEFSEFHPLFKKRYSDSRVFNREGDLRMAFYLAYEEDYVEYILMADLKERVRQNELIVSASFIIPYPPGFPVLVPGQLVSQEIVDYLSGLSVKEIHGYDESIGFRCFYNFILEYFYNLVTSDPYGYYHKMDKGTYERLKYANLSKRRSMESSYHLYIYDNETNKMKKMHVCNGSFSIDNNTAISDTYEDVVQVHNLRSDHGRGNHHHHAGAYDSVNNNSMSTIPTLPRAVAEGAVKGPTGSAKGGSAKGESAKGGSVNCGSVNCGSVNCGNERGVVRATDGTSNSAGVSSCARRGSREEGFRNVSEMNNEQVSFNAAVGSLSESNLGKSRAKESSHVRESFNARESTRADQRQTNIYYHLSNDMMKYNQNSSLVSKIKENVLIVQGRKVYASCDVGRSSANYRYRDDPSPSVPKHRKGKKCRGCKSCGGGRSSQAELVMRRGRTDCIPHKREDTNEFASEGSNEVDIHGVRRQLPSRASNGRVTKKGKKKNAAKRASVRDITDGESEENNAEEIAEEIAEENAEEDEEANADDNTNSDGDTTVPEEDGESTSDAKERRHGGKAQNVEGTNGGSYNARKKGSRRGKGRKQKGNRNRNCNRNSTLHTDDSSNVQSDITVSTFNQANSMSEMNCVKKETKNDRSEDDGYKEHGGGGLIRKIRQSNPVMCNQLGKSGLNMQMQRKPGPGVSHRNSPLSCADSKDYSYCSGLRKKGNKLKGAGGSSKREDNNAGVTSGSTSRSSGQGSGMVLSENYQSSESLNKRGTRSHTSGKSSNGLSGSEKTNQNATRCGGRNAKKNDEEVHKVKEMNSPNEMERNGSNEEAPLKREIFISEEDIDKVSVDDQTGSDNCSKNRLASEIHLPRSSDIISGGDDVSGSARRAGSRVGSRIHVNGNDANNGIPNTQGKNEVAFCGNEFHYDEDELKINSAARENNELEKNCMRKLNSLNNNSYINNLITHVDDDTFIHKESNFFLECALTNSEMNGSSFEMEMSLNNVYSNGGEGGRHPGNYDGGKKSDFE
ncbi:lysine decarboxylase [Plasmodium cynomolgi strain B]|uniref:Lysine decarboxylase n=1 Tax=Plasmodium cynomolgi (strain B) TaxID=1120755 RepID=K6V6I8_PLACD|nr:lysine decarboxylase [Plasmodium cynomolgi strain B]GAB64722.1 lysine decarboxylase [Plasmodium cynomolgi strain B]